MLRPGSIALALALSTALSGTCFGQSTQDQPKGENLPAGLSTQERSTGTNAKLDNALLGIKLRAAASSPGTETRALAETYVTVDIIAQGDVADLRAQLEQLGFHTEAVYRNDIGGRLPISQIDKVAALSGVITMSLPQKRSNSGRVNSQGDAAQRSKALREAVLLRLPTAKEPNPPHLDGAGLTIGVISGSFNCQGGQKDDIDNDDLPNAVNVVQERVCKKNDRMSDDEGRAMAQIIHDVAPGASIAFYAPNSMADFAQGVRRLAMPTDEVDAKGRHGAGAQIIVDDLTYYAEPLYQEGIVGAAIDEVATNYGTLYFSSAGNFANGGRGAYNNDAPVFAAVAVARTKVNKSPANLGERLLNFDTTGKTTVTNLPVTVPGGTWDQPAYVTIAAYWDQPMSGPNAVSSLNLCLDGGPRNTHCTYPSVIGQPAQALLQFSNSGDSYQAPLRLGLAGGPAPGRVHLVVLDQQTTIDQYGTSAGTITGHPLSPHAQAVGASDYFKTPYCNANLRTATLESFSSHGGTPVLFDNDGVALAKAVVPAKPDIVGPDGTSTTFFSGQRWDADADGAKVADCRTYPAYPFYFYGTSAAAPHAAAVAVLLMQAERQTQIPREPGIPPVIGEDRTAMANRMYRALQSTALDMDAAGFDYSSGHGFIQADQALAKLRANPLLINLPFPLVMPAKPAPEKVDVAAGP